EDGIRDGHVTGVQTCALPICRQALARRIQFWRPAAPDPMAEIERRAGDEEMGRLLRGLSPRERQVAYLYYFEDQSADEVGRALGIKPPPCGCCCTASSPSCAGSDRQLN